MEKYNRYTFHAISQFEDFSNPSICGIVLVHQSATTKRFVDAVNVTPGSIEIIAAAVGSNDRHHSPTAENIFIKWVCIVISAKNTLNNTTQEWVLFAVMPLTRRYRTDILYQDLLQLRTRFYTDKSLPKSKSVSGHIFAQISIYGEGFFWIVPFFGKAEFGTALRAFAKQVSIPYELHFDREDEQMGTHSDFQFASREFRIEWRNS